MRPINRGNKPLDEDTGEPIEYSKYGDYRGALIARIGEYCSYCERFLPASLAVEHIQPKSRHPDLELEWSNFLLACTNCNSTKGDTPIDLNAWFFPHKDNTFLAFDCTEGGVIKPNANLNESEACMAEETLKLVGLDKTPIHDPAASDRRWRQRLSAWSMANSLLEQYVSASKEIKEFLTDKLVDLAKLGGHWSIWFTVFEGESQILMRLIEELPGTAKDCFNSDCNSVPRPGGIL